MKTKVLIVGGGIAGLALALKLGNVGLPCAVIDPHAPQPYDAKQHGGRTAAIMGQSIDLLKSLKIWDQIACDTASLDIMRIIDDGNPALDPVEVNFIASEIGQENFGHNVPNCYLRKSLFDKAVENKNIEMLIPHKLQSFDVQNNHILAILDDGQEIKADIIIGADGRFSKIRDLAGIKHSETDYDQIAITCLISHTKPHGNVSTEHHRSGGPFTTVPMPDDENGNHYSSVVWVEKTDEAQKYLHLDKPLMEQTLTDKTRHALGDVKLESAPESWPLKALLAQDLTAPRIALIAEAAHAMSPIGAQGLNLSLRDVDILGDIILSAAQLGEDIGSDAILQRYNAARTVDLKTRFYGVDQYNKIVSNNIGFVRSLRRGGLNTLKTIPAFKQLAMQIGLKPAA